jgi:hypothetical protein
VVRAVAQPVTAGVSFAVHFPSSFGVTERMRHRVELVLREIGITLEKIPASSSYWSAVHEGVSELNLGGWRYEYVIDPDARALIVLVAYPTELPTGDAEADGNASIGAQPIVTLAGRITSGRRREMSSSPAAAPLRSSAASSRSRSR